MLAENFRKNLATERRKRGLSQDAVAKKVGVSVSYVSMLSRGQRTPPLDTVEAFAKALGLSPLALLK